MQQDDRIDAAGQAEDQMLAGQDMPREAGSQRLRRRRRSLSG